MQAKCLQVILNKILHLYACMLYVGTYGCIYVFILHSCIYVFIIALDEAKRSVFSHVSKHILLLKKPIFSLWEATNEFCVSSENNNRK